ncbi:Uncharacterised protein [Mycoplasmopsis californica]|uniref:Uncharacterized protein n=1 Tax=Mycoplasmopsis equigenitalium TaxID=114883 RepID=A0ABY5J1X9_9BACT|nr:hypothetical protein [Mycoplasmopsis equigenitalium]UUD37257.1 hypothetical protein NPA09_01645 [Mycoplasmopsis equigenitalium]VEU69435.1 Uncharacterised protein [Mycoplasmopsis californica]
MKKNSIQLLIDEVNSSLNSENYISALIVALVIPDVCGKILYPSASTTERYKKWFDKYIGDYEQSPLAKKDSKWNLPYMDGYACYKLRCAMLHEGAEDISKDIKIDKFKLLIGKDALCECSSKTQTCDETEVTEWYVNVENLCNKIVWSAEAFLKKENIDSGSIPTIDISDRY